VQKYRYDRVNGIQKEKKRVLRFRWSDRVDFVSIIVNTGMKRAVRFHIYPTLPHNDILGRISRFHKGIGDGVQRDFVEEPW
jgi:hypothetical protein